MKERNQVNLSDTLLLN